MLCLEIKIFFYKLVDLEKKLVTFPLFNSCLYISKNDPWIVKNCALAKVEIKLLFAYHVITWSMSHLTLWSCDTLTLNHPHHKVIVRATEVNKKNIYVLQIGAPLFYYKLGQTLLEIGAASLLQIRASLIINWGSYYKLGQVLRIRAIIRIWGITFHYV